MRNLPWEVEFDWEAEKNGLISVSVSFEVPHPTNPALTSNTGMLSVQCFVLKGWTPEQKAACIVGKLRNALGSVLDITYTSGEDDFKMKVKSNPGQPVPNAQAISGFSKVDAGTGEGISGVKDEPAEEVDLLTGYFCMYGVGENPDGVAQIQLGRENPMVEVQTFERSAEEVMAELLSTFNDVYVKLGFSAKEGYGGSTTAFEEVPCISIPEIPCPLGLRAGARDLGFTTEMGFVML